MRFFSFLFLFLLHSTAGGSQDFYKQGHFVVKGKVKHPKEQFVEYVVTSYLSNISGSIVIKADGSFEQSIPVQHCQNIYFLLNEDGFIFTVQDNDTLTMEWDDADFTNSFSIHSRPDVRTKELQLQWKQYLQFRKPSLALAQKIHEEEKNLSAEEKYVLINDLFNQNLSAVYDSAGFFNSNVNHQITDLYFKYTNLLNSFRLIPDFKLKLNENLTWKLPSVEIKNVSDFTDLNENWFWNCAEYRTFIYNYLRFTGACNHEKAFDFTRDAFKIAKACISNVNIRDWFIAKTIKFGFEYYNFSETEAVYKQAIKEITSPYLKDTLQKYYTAIQRLKLGNPAPAFSLQDKNGQSVSLSNFKGKVVYIDFWGVYCGPCIYAIKKSVPQLHERYKNKDVVFINICVDAKEADWKEALLKYKLDGVNLIAEGWTKNPICKDYNVQGIPHYILIDKNGNIANNSAPGPQQLMSLSPENNELDALLK